MNFPPRACSECALMLINSLEQMNASLIRERNRKEEKTFASVTL